MGCYSCSEAEEDLRFFDEEFKVSDCLGSIAYRVIESFRCVNSRVIDLVFCKTLFI
jgi:hypothetical protein